MKTQKIDLGNNNELIIRTQNEGFRFFGSRHVSYNSISEILLRNSEGLLCIGLCSSSAYTGNKEFIQYNPQCILFFCGNSITKTYHIERAFDIETMSSLFLTKDEILERYGIELSEEIKDLKVSKNRVKQKSI